MGDRDAILARIRGHQSRADVELPAVVSPITGALPLAAEPRARFETMLGVAGGRLVEVRGDAGLNAAVADLIKEVAAVRSRSILSRVMLDTGDGCCAADLDLLVAGGELAVAENGAVWIAGLVDDERAALFLAQHVVLVVDADRLVRDMHEAYARLDIGEHAFGVFIAGPSKTADIEQSLVIGAHGPRSLTVLLRQD